MISTPLAIGPIQLLFMLPMFFSIICIILIVFVKSNHHPKDAHLILIVGLYISSLTPLGIPVALYLNNRKVQDESMGRSYKYSYRLRQNANVILVVSIISTLFLFFK